MADGLTVDTSAINRAIDAASANRGGEVYFPAGQYRCFSIRLKSHMAIRFEPGATLIAALPGPMGGYDDVTVEPAGIYQDYGHSHWANSLIHGEGVENILIHGPGLLIGMGLTTAFPGVPMRAESPGVGNKAIALKNCRNVELSDFTIQEAGHFAILATGSDRLTIDGLLIDTNRDGIDIDCCRNVSISNCKVNSPFDDAICLKSSYALGYPRTTERVTVKNCEVSGFELGSLIDGRCERRWPSSPWPEDGLKPRAPTGRIKLGTESNGGFRNIAIVDCTFDNCRGLALETVDGGVLEDVRIAGIRMRDITAAPLFLRLGSRLRAPPGTPVGSMRRISVENLVCTNSVASLSSIISGIPDHYIQDLSLTDIHIEQAGGVSLANVPRTYRSKKTPILRLACSDRSFRVRGFLYVTFGGLRCHEWTSRESGTMSAQSSRSRMSVALTSRNCKRACHRAARCSLCEKLMTFQFLEAPGLRILADRM
jgi:polygalacturonase